MWQKAKIACGVIIALVTVIIVLQNTAEVETTLLFVSVKMPRAALLFGTLVIGFALGILTASRLMGRAKDAVKPSGDAG